jgi:hypothetical protein
VAVVKGEHHGDDGGDGDQGRMAQALVEKRVELPAGRSSAALADGAQLGRHPP